MIQVKLFELMDTEVTLSQLITIFGEQSILNFSDKIIGITYDYGLNSYVEILKKVKGLNLRQVIVSSSTFLNIIDYCVNKTVDITSLNFIYPISSESVEYVKDYIEQINATDGTEKTKNKAELFRELDWITSDECIDIKSVAFDMPNSKGIYYQVELYNNGVLLVNDKSVIVGVTDLIVEMFE